MATIEMANWASTNVFAPTEFTNLGKVYVAVREIDFAEATTEKGSALAASDVIEAIPVPADSLVLGGGIKVLEAMTGTSTDLTIDVGVTAGTVDALVDGFDLDGASADATSVANPMEVQYVAANDSIDILIATQTGTFTGGKVRVFALIAPVGEQMTKEPGRAQLGS